MFLLVSGDGALLVFFSCCITERNMRSYKNTTKYNKAHSRQLEDCKQSLRVKRDLFVFVSVREH